MTRIAAVLVLLGLALPAFGQLSPLRWAADEEGGVPFIYPDPRHPGKNKGFEVELAELLGRELGREVRWTHYSFNKLFNGLQRGDFDFAMNGLEVLPERLREVRFSRPYYIYRLQFAVRRNDSRFQSVQELSKKPGVQVGTLEGCAAEGVLDSLGVNKRAYSGQTELYKDLSTGRIDGVYIDTIMHNQYLPHFPDLHVVGPAENQGYYAIAFRKDDEDTAKAVDAALERLIRNGDLRRVYTKWHIWNDEQAELERFRAYDAAAKTREEWPFSRYFPVLLHGAGVTVGITVVSMALAVTIGLIVALARMYGPLPVRWLALLYVEFFRGVPVLLLLYFLYYGLADLSQAYGLGNSLVLSPLTAAVLGLGINYAAYEAEIYRAGITAVPRGQWEAAASLGMSGPLTFRRIILPQALRTILPPMTSDFVALFKDTSVVSIIAVSELSYEYQALSKTSFKFVEIGILTAALYLIMSVPLGYLSRWLEQRWTRG